MKVIHSENERVRAWIMAQASSPHDAAQQLYEEMGNKGDEHYVVIRADVVDYVYNLVIPVDAESGEWLREVHEMIEHLPGVKHTVVIPVMRHIPFPAHNAQGFITEREAEAGDEKGIKPGRQSHSPGQNAWG
jgi:DNA-binding Lrp family transcriptional regulator